MAKESDVLDAVVALKALVDAREGNTPVTNLERLRADAEKAVAKIQDKIDTHIKERTRG